jgi:hypothetical protein
MSASKQMILTANDWNTSSIKYMAPKINERGGKSISIISKQTNRSLHISTPLMMTWGIADFVNDNGESDGKYSMQLNFPNSEYATPALSEFLQKLKDFENQILDDAVTNSELWWGEEMSREVAKHTFFPFLKYTKNKDTKKVDLSKPPSIRAKVPYYNNTWAVEIYDTKQDLLFPCDNPNLTPVDFVPKQSNVACVLQCGGIWIGGKGWGLTWKLIQCIVKPREIQAVLGSKKCQIQISTEELDIIEKQPIADDESSETDEVIDEPVKTSDPVTTMVEDSDEDEEEEAAPVPTPVVKKVVKKVAAPVTETVFAATTVATESAPVDATAIKKKVVKKKVV